MNVLLGNAPEFSNAFISFVRSEESRSLGNKWHQGEKMMIDGNISKIKGEKYILKGLAMIKDGKRKVKKKRYGLIVNR